MTTKKILMHFYSMQKKKKKKTHFCGMQKALFMWHAKDTILRQCHPDVY